MGFIRMITPICNNCHLTADWSERSVAEVKQRNKVYSEGWHFGARDICPECWVEGKR